MRKMILKRLGFPVHAWKTENEDFKDEKSKVEMDDDLHSN